MKTITTLEQWLDAAMPFVIMEIEAAYADEYYFDACLHGLLLAMPEHTRSQLPNYNHIREYWSPYPRDSIAWCPEAITDHAVLVWLRNQVVAGDLDTLADATALAVPELVGNELCEQLLDVVQRKLDSWEWGAVEEFTGLICEETTYGTAARRRPSFYPMQVKA